MFLLYRNQSIDLQRRSIHWFLYDEKIGRKQVNALILFGIVLFGGDHNWRGSGVQKGPPA